MRKKMTIVQAFLEELRNEAKVTKIILERVPIEKGDWKPHEKSMGLLRLASHVAEVMSWVDMTVRQDGLDFSKMDYKPFIPENTEALLQFHEKNIKIAESALEQCTETELDKIWTGHSGDQVFFAMPKLQTLRGMCFNHLVHHRAQLGVYLRLLDIPVPGSYGPTADEQ
jgi:uncharacterized damage-inducible protein DinB